MALLDVIIKNMCVLEIESHILSKKFPEFKCLKPEGNL